MGFWEDVDRHLVRYSAAGRFTPEVIVRAEGSYVFTESGRRILDFTSGQMSAILGHSHPEIVATVRRQSATLDLIDAQSVGSLAACIIEPILSSAAGARPGEAGEPAKPAGTRAGAGGRRRPPASTAAPTTSTISRLRCRDVRTSSRVGRACGN